jgi:hypothetical protein
MEEAAAKETMKVDRQKPCGARPLPPGFTLIEWATQTPQRRWGCRKKS